MTPTSLRAEIGFPMRRPLHHLPRQQDRSPRHPRRTGTGRHHRSGRMRPMPATVKRWTQRAKPFDLAPQLAAGLDRIALQSALPPALPATRSTAPSGIIEAKRAGTDVAKLANIQPPALRRNCLYDQSRHARSHGRSRRTRRAHMPLLKLKLGAAGGARTPRRHPRRRAQYPPRRRDAADGSRTAAATAPPATPVSNSSNNPPRRQ